MAGMSDTPQERHSVLMWACALVILLAIAAPCVVYVARVQRQRAAVAAIGEAGGQVCYVEAPIAKHLPGWVRSRLPHDYYQQPFLASLAMCTDAEMEHLGALPHLQELSCVAASVTDAGLKHVRGLTRLGELDLSGTQITDAGLQDLNGLSELRRLDVSGTKVTAEGVRSLKEALPECQVNY
jgi:hypothetical protein